MYVQDTSETSERAILIRIHSKQVKFIGKNLEECVLMDDVDRTKIKKLSGP